jgi:3-keto-L-gulonate-6-phosphate decarboxylase
LGVGGVILQVAFDDVSAIREELIAPYSTDPNIRFEFGTPIINELGYSQLANSYSYIPPDKVFADTKTIDFHLQELNGLYRYGFNKCSFLLGSEPRALVLLAQSSVVHKFEIWISTMGTPLDSLHREATVLARLGYRFFVAHGHGVDLKDAFEDMVERYEILRSIHDAQIIVAGGITLERLDVVRRFNPYAMVVGRAITAVANPSCQLKDFRDALFQ